MQINKRSGAETGALKLSFLSGINVNRYKYIATCVGSMIAGLGGLYYVMDYAYIG